MKIQYNKLVRDGIPRIIRESGKECQVRTLTANEFRLELIRKLQEELTEFVDNPSVEELADMLEVMHALATILGFDFNEVIRYKESKRADRGVFKDKLYLEWVREVTS